jgi:alpha-tubulin suppressor-like RCC1 family protein
MAADASAVSGGFFHGCALTVAGGAKCWGDNSERALGDGTTKSRHTPVDVNGLSSGVVAITPGQVHTCAITTGGGAQCWGDNTFGAIGDGTTDSRLAPVDVSGLTTGVDAITAGWHTCALTTGGGVKCWGPNDSGQLGDGTTDMSLIPVDVSGLTSGVAAITAGGQHTCASTTGGGVKCWGDNFHGSLGDGTTSERDTPVDVVGLAGGVVAISTNETHTCALTTGGGVKCWGDNRYGQLGDGTTKNRHTPVDVSGLTTGVSAITTGYHYSCALTTSGGLKCWGTNFYGQLGDGTYQERHTPVDVAGLSSGVASISKTAGWFTCALTTNAGAMCWGNNNQGQLGDGTEKDRRKPVAVVGFVGAYQPDATIARFRSGLYSGNDVYNTSGSGQTQRTDVKPGRTATFYVRVQNDGTSSDTFTLEGANGKRSGFIVHYFHGTTNITSSVWAGSFSTGAIASSEAARLRITVKARSTTDRDSLTRVRLTASSVGEAGRQDVAKANVRVG